MVEERQTTETEALGAWIQIKPFRALSTTLIVTGSEVFHGRIADRFGPGVEAKLASYGGPMVYKAYSDDQADLTAAKIREAEAAGAELIPCTGGMSVDPDDAMGADLPIMGLPGAVIKMGHGGLIHK